MSKWLKVYLPAKRSFELETCNELKRVSCLPKLPHKKSEANWHKHAHQLTSTMNRPRWSEAKELTQFLFSFQRSGCSVNTASQRSIWTLLHPCHVGVAFNRSDFRVKGSSATGLRPKDSFLLKEGLHFFRDYPTEILTSCSLAKFQLA